MSTFHGLEVGRRGITTAQNQINTTGHNMTNAATPGYSRQNVSASATTPQSVFTSSSTPGQLGTGLLTDAIVRLRDHFLDGKFWTQNSNTGSLEAQARTMKELESIVKTAGEGTLPQSMQDVWNAWQNVANNPTDAGAKKILQERAKSFLTTAQTMDKQFAQVEMDLQSKVDFAVTETNQLLQGIRDLNEVIQRSSGKDNDAMDQRDRLIDQLSKKVGIDVVRTNSGMVQISLKTADASATPTILVNGRDDITPIVDGTDIVSGELAGLVKSQDDVANYRAEFQDTVKSFIESNGIANDNSQLFVGDAISFDLDTITVSTSKALTEPTTVESEKYAIQSKWQSTVANLGTKANGVYRAHQTAELATTGINNDRQSVMGVSLDEEMSNLIKFQHAYNAAARMVSTTDQLLDTLINRLGAR
ncbi:flagellar hook-associated protein FlgK [Chryseomicrobium palamuruense]|uniref:Flagellar hook-associated protein 1 n=1 Tax=Chryseomicrobium palamuruense TaxID=682973 RepID=A0ABV8UVQ4_9BACL